MRREYSVESSEVYMISPHLLRELGLELIQRTRDNVYGSHREYKKLTQEGRAAVYDELKAKIGREGFSRDMPIMVMLKRNNPGLFTVSVLESNQSAVLCV